MNYTVICIFLQIIINTAISLDKRCTMCYNIITETRKNPKTKKEKEVITMKNVRYEYADNSVCTEDSIVISDSQTFGDWLAAGSVRFEQNGNCYYVLDQNGERTGITFTITNQSATNDPLTGGQPK